MFVTKDDPVLKLERRTNRAQVLGVEGQRALETDDDVGEEDRDGGEDDHRAGVALPGLLLFGAGAEESIDRTLQVAEEVHAALEHGRHVGAEVAPRNAEQHHQGQDGEEESHLELLGLEHGVAQVAEHEERDHEQEDLTETHTRSNAQMSPRNTTVNATMPRTE